MEPSPEKFDFQATVRLVGDAAVSVICHILFDFALVGIGVAVVLSICAFVLGQRKHHFSRPFYIVARRIATACAALSVPGFGFLIFTGHLPASGVYLNFSFGFLVLWSMVTIYLCAEEMNFEWFTRGEKSPQVIEDETQVISSAERISSASGSKTQRRQSAEEGETTLKLPREGETANGEVTLKLSRDEESAGDVTVKISKEEDAAVGDVTLKIGRDDQSVKSELTEGDVALRS